VTDATRVIGQPLGRFGEGCLGGPVMRRSAKARRGERGAIWRTSAPRRPEETI